MRFVSQTTLPPVPADVAGVARWERLPRRDVLRTAPGREVCSAKPSRQAVIAPLIV